MPSPAELHAVIVARIQERLALAQAATPGPWHTPGPDSIAQWGVYDAEWLIASATAYDHNKPMSNRPGARGPGYIDPDANAVHIAANDPAFTIRMCTAALDRLDRHRPVSSTASSTPDWCGCCGEDAPCPDVRDEAAVWDVEVDGDG